MTLFRKTPTEFVKNGKSDIHANLERKKFFDEGWWCYYLVCCGRIVGNVGEPYFGGESKRLCSHETCECVGFGDPFCSNIETQCCLTSQCAIPPLQGSPTCVCCTKKVAAGDTSQWKPKLFEWSP